MATVNSSYLGRLAQSRDGPEGMQAFVGGHGPFLTLLTVLLAQLLLLSFQISRNHNVRLIKLWTGAVFRPFQHSLHTTVGGTSRAWSRLHELWGAESENQRLHTDLVPARAQIQQLSQQAAEAGRLRELLDLKARLPFPSIAAEVIEGK